MLSHCPLTSTSCTKANRIGLRSDCEIYRTQRGTPSLFEPVILFRQPKNLQRMWPWGHAAAGYLVYMMFRRVQGKQWPTDDTRIIALAIGTQFPDLVDKPLAWSLGILPSGRSLAHSLLIGTVFLIAVLALARRYNRSEIAGAFTIGYYSHLLGDALPSLVQLRFEFLSFLAWPLLAPPPYENDSSFVAHLVNLSPSPLTIFGFLLTISTIVVWVQDGTPGFHWLRGTKGSALSDD